MKTFYSLMLFCILGFIYADSSPSDFVIRLQLKSGQKTRRVYTYYNPFLITEKIKHSIRLHLDTIGLRNSSRDYNYADAFSTNLFVKSKINVTDTFYKKANVPFAFATPRTVDLGKFDSIVIDSILWGELSPSFKWLDSLTTTNILKKNVNVFEIFLSDCDSYHEKLRVISFDSIWTTDYFMSQFTGYKNFIKKRFVNDNSFQANEVDFYKQSMFWDYYRDELKLPFPELISEPQDGENGAIINVKNFPHKIRSAISSSKIVVLPHYVY